MTLILTRASQDFVIQAVDRLVVDSNGRIRDERANKSIVYICANAAVAIAYTGIAILDKLATDEWLVEHLTGQTFDRNADRSRPPLFGNAASLAHEGIGSAIRRLKVALEKGDAGLEPAARRHWRDYSFDLVAAGYQWNKRCDWRPVLGWITKESGEEVCDIGYKQRLWHYPGPKGIPTVLSVAPKGNASRSEMAGLSERMQNQSSSSVTQLLVDSIRSVSSTNPRVGPDILAVALSPPNIGQVAVTDHPVVPRSHAIPGTFAPGTRAQVTLMPWIVGPGVVRPPAFQSRDVEIQVGRYQVLLQGAENSVSGNFFEASLPRLRRL